MSTELPPTTAELAFFDRAIVRVESDSIRQWAGSERNKPLFLYAIRSAIALRGDCVENELRFATFVTCEAMGL